MILSELIQLKEDAIFEYLMGAARAYDHELPALQAAALDAVRAGELSREQINRWVAASRRAGEALQIEAAALELDGRMREAGIRGIIKRD